MDEKTVLSVVKTYVTVSPEDDAFDQELILDILPAISKLNQLGVQINKFDIDKDTKWSDVIASTNTPIFGFIVEYIGVSVRQVFNPATSSFLQKTLDDRIAELSFRIIHGLEVND